MHYQVPVSLAQGIHPLKSQSGNLTRGFSLFGAFYSTYIYSIV